MGKKRQNSFPTTDWQLVWQAGKELGRKQASLSELFTLYAPAIRAFLIRKGFSEDAADDIVQGFVVEKVLERGIIEKADQSRGRFRNFLLRSLQNFITDLERREQASALAPGQTRVLQMTDETPAPSSHESDPSEALEQDWARMILDHALDMTRERCCARGEERHWSLFVARILEASPDGPLSYQELHQRFNFESPVEASNALVTCKRIFVRCLRKSLAQFMSDDDVRFDSQLQYLRKIFASNSRRISDRRP